ncbi:Zinc finger BED domain-containing protein RICESLEEPER 2 [Linum perenne]
MTCADSIHSSQGANSSHSASPVIGENDAPTATNSVETLHGNSVTTTPVEVQPGEISNNGTIEEEIIDSSRLSSPVWQHFVRLKVKGLLKARCNKCRKLLGATAGSGTSHLREHISRCPKRIMKDIRQMLLTKNLKGDVHKSIGTKFDADEGRRALASMIILHEYPMCIVDHIGFRRFLFIIQPLFHCPTRNTIKGDIFKIFDSEKKLLKKQLDANQSRIAITSDMWTASNQKKGFMVVTAHFIDEGWNIQSYILRFLYVPCPHTSEVLSQVLVDTIIEWNIDTKLSTITLDNCSTNDALIDVVKDKLSCENMMWNGSKLHMRCCAHILNLIVKDGLDVIKKSIDRIRDSVSFWTATPKRQEKFEESVKHLRISYGRKLSLDCPTRWNSTYLMLHSAIMYKDVFPRLKIRDPLYKSLPSESDWGFAKKCCSKLELFYDITELFSGSKYPTANLFFEKICDIKVGINEWLVDEDPFISNMASNMLFKFDKYWSSIHDVLAVAAVFDPRFKFTLLNFYFPTIYGAASREKIQSVRQLLVELEKEYKTRLQVDVDLVDGSSSGASSNKNSGSKMTAYDIYVASLNASSEDAGTELDSYLFAKVLPRTEDFDVLLWWKANALTYPTLAMIARDVLAVPVTTVASESAFSSGGRLVSPSRSRLHSDTVEALMCAQNWLQKSSMTDELGQLKERSLHTVHEDEDDDLACITGSMTISDK